MTYANVFTRDNLHTMARMDATPLILCIDDDPEIVRAVELRLQNYTVRVLGVFSGSQGYWMAINRHPDLIITDMHMPQGDGIFLLECLKGNQSTADIPVLVLSGLRDRGLSGRVRNLGAEGLLQKPIRAHDLLQEVKRCVPQARRSPDRGDEMIPSELVSSRQWATYPPSPSNTLLM